LIGLVVVTLLLTLPVFAQNNTGIISGKVTDQTGAVVPNAAITVTQTDTGVNSVSQSNSDGLFRIPGLRDGPYKATVKAPGFKELVREGFVLRIGENLNVDLKLEVGAVTESIDVVNTIPMLDTQTSSTGQVMEGEYFYDLPNYQHWEKGVLYYTPQVEGNNGMWPGALGNFVFNGANTYQTATYEDGMLSTTMDGGTTINSISVGDEEIKVISSAFPAEFGHATSGALIVVKKAGTNTFHGEGGYLFKNDPMEERRFFQLQTNPQVNAHDLFQMPDLVVAGPIWIPHVYNGKNRTFFEVASSWHVDASSNAGSFSVPTAAELNGDFSLYSNVIYDAGTTSGQYATATLNRNPFPNNTIPQSRFGPLWKNLMSNNPWAAPTSTGSILNTGTSGNIITQSTGNYYNRTYQGRLDHSFTDKLKLMASWTEGFQHQPGNDITVLYKPYDSYQVLTYTVQNSVSLNLTYTLKPTLISETRFGGYRRTGNPQSLTGADYTFQIAKAVPNLPANVYVGAIGFGLSESGNGASGLGVGTLSVNVNNVHQVNQDFTWVKGTHAFKFGYEWLWENQDSHNTGVPRLSLSFGGSGGFSDGLGTGKTATGGITMADVMLGYVTSYSYAQQGTPQLPVDSNQSFYFQDDWRVLPKLTLNLGVRWEQETPAHSKFPGGFSNGSVTVASNYYTSGSVANLLTCPNNQCLGGWVQPQGFIWNRQWKNFQPRFGLAYNVMKDTVLRGGFSLMTLDYNLGYTQQAEIGGGSFFNQSVSAPVNTSGVANSSNYPLFLLGQAYSAGSISYQYPQYASALTNGNVPAFTSVAQLPNGEIPTSASSPSGRPTITVYPANYHHPYTLNWNVSIQHSLWKNYVLELDYVGLHNVGFGGSYNWDSRLRGTGIDSNGNVIDLTQPANFTYRNSWITNSSGVNGTQAYKPYPSLGGVNWQCNCVMTIYHSGTIKLEKRYSYGLSFLTFLTYQKGIGNSPGNLYQNQNEARAVSGITQKYRFTSSMTYELPMGKGKPLFNQNKWANYLLGGYSFSWNFSVWAPNPLGIGYSGQNVVNPATGAVAARQDYPSYELAPGSGIYLLQDPQLRSNWQDIGTNRFVQTGQNPIVTNCGTTPILLANGATWGNNCEVIAPSFQLGNLPGNEWISQRIIGANASIFKDIPIKERMKAQVRLDYLNPFKWYNWTGPTTTMTQTSPATFMTPGTSDIADSQEGGPPEMLLSFRLHF